MTITQHTNAKNHRETDSRWWIRCAGLLCIIESVKLKCEHIKKLSRWRQSQPKFLDASFTFVASRSRRLISTPVKFLQYGCEAVGVVHDLPTIREDNRDTVGACGVVACDFHGLSCKSFNLGFNSLCASTRYAAHDGINGATALTVSTPKRASNGEVASSVILAIHCVPLVGIVARFGQVIDSAFNGVKIKDWVNVFTRNLIAGGVVSAEVAIVCGVVSSVVVSKNCFNSDGCSSGGVHFISCFRLGSFPLGVFKIHFLSYCATIIYTFYRIYTQSPIPQGFTWQINLHNV